MRNTTPTDNAYKELITAYQFFNAELFSNALPDCIITLNRKDRTAGYFSFNRFTDHAQEMTDEIALNPSHFAVRPLIATLSTLVHEMVHLWQYRHGEPGRGRYHNSQWANKMESLGLMPSNTGQPGGKRTGDNMTHYVIDEGQFSHCVKKLLDMDFNLSWHDRFPRSMPDRDNPIMTMEFPEHGKSILADKNYNVILPGLLIAPPKVKNKSNRHKYTCSCGNNVWGKPELYITCRGCGQEYEDITEK